MVSAQNTSVICSKNIKQAGLLDSWTQVSQLNAESKQNTVKQHLAVTPLQLGSINNYSISQLLYYIPCVLFLTSTLQQHHSHSNKDIHAYKMHACKENCGRNVTHFYIYECVYMQIPYLVICYLSTTANVASTIWAPLT